MLDGITQDDIKKTLRSTTLDKDLVVRET